MSILCKIGLHSWNGCKCSKCDITRDEQHNWSNFDCSLCSRCGRIVKENHSWDGCKCKKCKVQRDTDHSWSQGNCNYCFKCGKLVDNNHIFKMCKCIKCSKENHSWDGCKCVNCGKVRDEQHMWNGCLCDKCNKNRDEQHLWDGCKCLRCANTRDDQHSFEGNECKKCNMIKDIENNHYHILEIGDQIWMLDNLNVSQFQNGNNIQEAKTEFEWNKAFDTETPAYMVSNFGKLYNRFAISDKQRLAPEGWHIVNDDEVITLWLNNQVELDDENYFYYKSENGRRIKLFDRGIYLWLASQNSSKSEYFFIPRKSDNISPRFISGTPRRYEEFYVRCIKNQTSNTDVNTSDDKRQKIFTPFEIDFPKECMVQDIDGNRYKTFEIDGQVWMLDNLNVSRFQNKYIIQEAKTEEEWKSAYKHKIPAWCYYKNDMNRTKDFGKLYNWFAVADKRGLAPSGWHIPNKEELYSLKKMIENYFTDYGKVELSGNSATYPLPNPGGYREAEGEQFSNQRLFGYFWSVTEDSYYNDEMDQIYYEPFYLKIFYKYGRIKLNIKSGLQGSGFSVICKKN